MGEHESSNWYKNERSFMNRFIMRKGERTREAILDAAVDLASIDGIEGLSIGELAKRTGMSKSGLFRHFGSREALQTAVLERASAIFVDIVVAPARREPRGMRRLRALFDNWVKWSDLAPYSGGCPLQSASFELDDRPGPARDFLAWSQREWLRILTANLERAVEEGDLPADTDSAQLAREIYASSIGFEVTRRLIRDPDAERHARRAFERMVGNPPRTSPAA